MLERKLGSATRDAYGKALAEIGRDNPNLIVLDADLSKSTKTEIFGKAYPDRFIDIGIQECNLVGIAAGLAISGKIPFISSFACFLMCKGYDQLRMCVAFPNLNVKVVTSHGGISVGEDGASQQSVEDIALACTLPNFVVMIPADEFQAKALVKLAAAHQGPVYIRTGRPKVPVIYGEKSVFEIGKGVRLREGKDLTIVAAGLLVFEALEAAEMLAKDGISVSVIDMHTVKPLDEFLLLEQAKKTGAVLVAEEHLIWGGLGSAVSQCLSKNYPVPMDFVGLQDTYAESGKPGELLEKYGLTSKNVSQVARRLVARKSK
jgi:transketolase